MGTDGAPPPELLEVEGALQDALRDMRAIAAGLRMPELAPLSVAQVADRAVADHARRTGQRAGLAVAESVPAQVPLPIRIALYRAIQELLSNAFRHGRGAPTAVRLDADDAFLAVEVADQGPGFDPTSLVTVPGLGLAGMREQAELLGGDFEVISAPGAGTTIRIRWPLPRGRRPAGGVSYTDVVR